MLHGRHWPFGKPPDRRLRNPAYLDTARRAYDYFIEHFIDKEYGGVYWSVDYKGQPLDTKKQFYAIGFAIYGLSEYARATGDREALDYALQLYNCIEEHAFDKAHNGYIEACTRAWGPPTFIMIKAYCFTSNVLNVFLFNDSEIIHSYTSVSDLVVL